MAFWVKSLDDYILHWNLNKNDDINLEYFGMEWSPDWNVEINDDEFMENKIFYSILIHSPLSAINYEFISYHKPSFKLYKNIKWITSDLPRCTFKTMKNPYPWDRKDNAKIVPVRISRATTNIDKIYDFYINILEATLIHYAVSDIAMEADSKMKIATKTMFILLCDTEIELEFVERPNYYTSPGFTLIEYENMLLETHDTIITSPYCGIDRWLDNHYSYSTWTIDGFMDRIINKLNGKRIVYRLSKLSYEHSSIFGKTNLDFYGYDEAFGMSVIEPTGQSIDIGGYISDGNIQKFTPVGNLQWCYEQCPGGLMEGHIDPSRIYIDSDDDDDDETRFNQQIKIMNWSGNNNLYYIAIGIVAVLICILFFIHYCCNNDNGSSKYQYTPLL